MTLYFNINIKKGKTVWIHSQFVHCLVLQSTILFSNSIRFQCIEHFASSKLKKYFIENLPEIGIEIIQNVKNNLLKLFCQYLSYSLIDNHAYVFEYQNN